MASWAVDLFGPELLVKGASGPVKKETSAVVTGKKFVGLYFSAHVRSCESSRDEKCSRGNVDLGPRFVLSLYQLADRLCSGAVS